MLDDQLADRAIAGNDVDDTGRQPGPVGELGEQQCRQAGVFGRLQHHCVTRGQRRCQFPSQHQQGEIPGNDLAGNAQRLLAGELVFEQLGPAGVVVKMASHQGHVDIAAFANRLAVVQRLEHRQQAGLALHHAGQGIERPGPAAAQPGPGRLRFPGCRHGALDVGLRGLGDLGELFVTGRIMAI